MAARRYNAAFNCVTTASGSTTLPIANLVGATTTRPEIYHYTLGSDATPASNAAKFTWQRGTTVGTWGGAGGAAITPKALDPLAGTEIASLCTFNQGICSVGPTLTASTFVHQCALNMQASIIVNFNDGAGLIVPNVSNNGLNLMSLVNTASYNVVGTVMWSE